jgi:protein-serine/threonine kinase
MSEQYAMLAGYLPFDDDPANPEGDNINLLYKYITTTPLTFPEYVTPHARDLLRRILVPDPRKRADLFEVARHSWLSEYASVVEFITSTTTTTELAVQNVRHVSNHADAPMLGRSASVREPSKQTYPGQGDLARKHGNVDQEAIPEDYARTSKDNKRRTVQVEYVAPRSETVRGHEAAATASAARTRARPESQGPVEVPTSSHSVTRKALPTEDQAYETRDAHYSAGTRPAYDSNANVSPTVSRPSRDPPRSVSDNAFANMVSRPMTGGSLTSATSGRASMGLQNRGSSYGQPAAPRIHAAPAHGQMAQSERSNLAESIRDDDAALSDIGSPSISSVPTKFDRMTGFSQMTGPQAIQAQPQPIVAQQAGNHKRSSTVGSFSERFFGRRGSLFGGSRSDKNGSEKPMREKTTKRYPPVSMQTNPSSTGLSRPSMERSSRRSMSFGFSKKRSNSIMESETSDNKPRRNSFLPASFSLRSIGIGGNNDSYDSQSGYDSQELENGQQGSTTSVGRANSQEQSQSGIDHNRVSRHPSQSTQERRAPPKAHERYSQQRPDQPSLPANNVPSYTSTAQRREDEPRQRQQRQRPISYHPESYGSALMQTLPQSASQQRAPYPSDFNEGDDNIAPGNSQDSGPQNRGKSALPSANAPSIGGNKGGRGVLQKPNRRFEDSHERQDYSRPQNSGSNGAARRVMDFFRRRGRDRGD